MAFEVVGRSRGGITEYDPVQRLYRWSGIPGRLNHETAPDSGLYQSAVNLKPIRTNTPDLNGFRAGAADWHYAIQTQESTSEQYPVGSVGFGGRQGEQWLVLRFRGLYWVDWATRESQQIDTATYDPANLSAQTQAVQLAGEQTNLNTRANWSSLMTTPDGGVVSMEMRLTPHGLKWLIGVNEQARDYYQANSPPPSADWYLTAIFDVDLVGKTDFPRFARLLRGQTAVDLNDPNLNIDDDGERFNLENALGKSLGWMPPDTLFVGPPASRISRTLPARLPLHKKLYKTGGNAYLGVGVRAGDLADLPGALLFDPNYSIAESAEDGNSEGTNENVDVSQGAYGSFWLGYDGYDMDAAYIWETAIPQGATVQSATVELDDAPNQEHSGSPDGDWYGFDVDSPDDFDNTHTHRVSDHHARTSASVSDSFSSGESTHTTPSLVSPVQEVVNRSGFDGRLGLTWRNTSTGTAYWEWTDYSHNSGNVAKLTVTWQASGPDLSSYYRRPNPLLRM